MSGHSPGVSTVTLNLSLTLISVGMERDEKQRAVMCEQASVTSACKTCGASKHSSLGTECPASELRCFIQHV